MFLTRPHHEDIIREKNMQIGYRDHRIAELEAERKLLWDKLCLLEIGEPIFDVAPAQKPNAGVTTCHPEPSATCEVKDLNSPSIEAPHPEPEIKSQPKASPESPLEGQNNAAHCANGGSEETPTNPKSTPEVAVRLGRPCPSQIMRRMDRLMHNRWLQKLRPSKAADSRDE